MSRDVLERQERPPKPPPDALEILGRWRLARLIGDRANEYHAIAQLRELATRNPKRKADRTDAVWKNDRTRKHAFPSAIMGSSDWTTDHKR